MIILGLTGSIGMGKSFVASMFRRFHIPVFDADHAVHLLLGPNGAAVKKVAAQFPGTEENGAINRQRLGKIVFQDKAALDTLEKILHPLVRQAQNHFIRWERRKKHPLIVLEIPLLFEVKAQKRCDKIITVTAPFFLQKKRVLKRPLMTEEKLAAILKRQVSDFRKRTQTDYLIYTGLGKAAVYRQIKNIITEELRCAK